MCPRASGHVAKTQTSATVRSVSSVFRPMVSHFIDGLIVVVHKVLLKDNSTSQVQLIKVGPKPHDIISSIFSQ